MSNGGATIDELVTFKYNKKKFSFAKKNTSLLSTDDGGSGHEKSESSSEDSDLDELREKNLNWKGSAKLKVTTTAYKSSSEDEAAKSKKHKKSSNKHKKESRNEEKLEKLYRMFPHHNVKTIQMAFAKNDQNAKKCAEYLLKEKENGGVSAENDVEIEEWSDGNEGIRARNAEARNARKLSEEQSDSSLNTKKRKVTEEEENSKEPLKKRAKNLIVSSDEEDQEATSSVKPKISNINDSDERIKKSSKFDSSSENDSDDASSTTSGAKSTASMSKPGKKKLCILDSSEDDQAEKKSSKKSNKKEKKEKKNKKNKKSKQIDEEADDFDDGDDYEKGGGASDDSDFESENYTDEQKEAILKMFNEASIEDIQSMINISKGRVKSLVDLRPFVDFTDIQNRLSQRHLVNVINSAKDIIVARSIVGNLLEKCLNISEKLANQVATLVESINDSDSQLKANNVLELKTQPACLNKKMQLKPYQLIGLNWLCLMHKEKINGILADEMGLGKTCQTISFLAHLYETNKKLMHLIIVPPSTLDNWVREISVWCPEFNFTVYQGNLEERRQLRYDILNQNFEKPLNAILTTYGLISSTNEDKAFFKKIKIDYCIFDEAHMLKNMNSIRYQSLIKIQSKHRLLLTGTPLQNNLVELMSLLYFVMPDIFLHKTEYLNKIFASKPANVDTDTFYNEKIEQAKGIMKPFILRRLKDEVLKQLPKKTIEVIHCDMTLRQGKEYKKLVEHFKERKEIILRDAQEAAEKKKSDKNSKKTTNYEEIMEIIEKNNTAAARKKATEEERAKESSSNILMELRKAANHPLLRRVLYNNDKIAEMAKLVFKESPPGTVLDYVREDMSYMSDFELHKLCPKYRCLRGYELSNQDILDSAKFTILDSLLAEKKESGDRCLIFSQFVIMLDIVEEFLKIKKYQYFRLDGTTAVSERQDMIDAYNHDSDVFIFLLSTKAGGVGINLTAANVVIMHDIDYNPFNDKQAEDRCHRVGQTREVHVYKLIAKNTIDCTMLKIQERKLELGDDMSGQNDENQKGDMIAMLSEALKF